MTVTAFSLCCPSREERHCAPASASGPVWPAAHLRRHAAHPEPRGAARHRGDPGRWGQAGPTVWDRWSQEPGSQPDAAGLGLQPPPRPVIVEEGGKSLIAENQQRDEEECLHWRSGSDKWSWIFDQVETESLCHMIGLGVADKIPPVTLSNPYW